MKVIIQSDKSTISRTLTRKGSSTINLIFNGIKTTLQQNQLSEKLGSTDLFLSVVNPGYFLKLSPEKKQEVISEIQGSLDRYEILKSLTGIVMTPEQRLKFNLSRRLQASS